MAVNELLVAQSITDILEVMFLDGQIIDRANSLASIRVDKFYRLELTFHEENGLLTGVTIHRLIGA